MATQLAAWRLDAPATTLVLASEAGATPWIAYWDRRLPADEDLDALVRAGRLPVQGGEVDVKAPIAVLPEPTRGHLGSPGLVASRDGTALRPRFSGHVVEHDGARLRWSGTDAAAELDYHLEIERPTEGATRLTARLVNRGSTPVLVNWLAAPALPVHWPSAAVRDHAGRWCGEFRPAVVPWAAGARVREARQGRPGHGAPPFLVVTGTNDREPALSIHVAWTGGHRVIAEELPDGRRFVLAGAMPADGGEVLAPGAELNPPFLYAVRSLDGDDPSRHFHATARRLVRWPDPTRPRPVHYNCWEAVYFDHDQAHLRDLANRAHALGAERFVLDDGWFTNRRDDTRALGDWTVDAEFYPDGLQPLIDHVQRLGMTFGLWVEPEMINPDSDLFRRHPEWVLGPLDQPLARQQLALDLSRADVQAYLFGVLDDLLRAHPIDYLKWDHNRGLPFPEPSQTLALYALLDRLRAAHPAVEIESCASGGARIDFGVLERTHRFWLSDSNDALERLRMQHEAARFLPPELAGSHVGPRHCHTSGRELPMAFRAWVAAQRHMGFEMDLAELTDDEREVLRDVVAWWKANRSWLFQGRLWHLDMGDPSVVAEMTVAADGSRFVVFAGQAQMATGTPAPLRLKGLDANRRYRVRLTHPLDPPPVLNRLGHALDTPSTLTGAALMAGVLRPPGLFPATMLVLEGEAV